jgi:hypothetical protein
VERRSLTAGKLNWRHTKHNLGDHRLWGQTGTSAVVR